MYIEKIRNFFGGYVRLKVEGYSIEKFINSCKFSGLCIGNIKRRDSTTICISVPVKSYKEVTKISKKNNCRFKILDKRGIPFFINRYRKRKVFVVSLIVIALLVWGMSNFVWKIEINGNEQISDEELLEIAHNNGLEVGKLKKNIDTKAIAENFRLEKSDIAWIGIKKVGTIVKIDVVEELSKPKVIDESEICNIVAKKDAMITSIEAQNGTIMVGDSEVVKKGDILIAGWLEGKYTGTRYVHATGKVMAKTWYKKSKKIMYNQSNNNRTGNVENRYSICINNFEINFYKKLSKFEIYDTIRAETQLKISSNFYLPILFVKKQNYEVNIEQKKLSKDEAIDTGIRQLDEEFCNDEIEGDVINKYKKVTESSDGVEVELIYEVLEDIGTEEKIAL